MSIFQDAGQDLVVEGMTEDRLRSRDVAAFGRLSPSETQSPVRASGRSVLMGPLPFLLSGCTPRSVPRVIGRSCTGYGLILPESQARGEEEPVLLRVGNRGTCRGSCLVSTESGVVAWPEVVCQLEIAASGQATGVRPANHAGPSAPLRRANSKQGDRLRVKLSVCCVSWISNVNVIDMNALEKLRNSYFRFGDSSWVVKTLIALRCTANPSPPPAFAEGSSTSLAGGIGRVWRRPPPGKTLITLDDFRAAGEYRALSYFRLIVDLDLTRDRIVNVKCERSYIDPGWTPAFKWGECPSGFFVPDTWDFAPQPGEQSSISGLSLGPKRHPNSFFRGTEGQPVANLVAKFRAGRHTDEIGLTTAGSRFHVPWVWSETLLTFSDSKFRLLGVGSEFPSHAWYVNGRQVGVRLQAGDAFIPFKSEVSQEDIDLERLKLYRIIRVGRPSTLEQSRPDENHEGEQDGPIDGHENTVEEGPSLVECEWEAK